MAAGVAEYRDLVPLLDQLRVSKQRVKVLIAEGPEGDSFRKSLLQKAGDAELLVHGFLVYCKTLVAEQKAAVSKPFMLVSDLVQKLSPNLDPTPTRRQSLEAEKAKKGEIPAIPYNERERLRGYIKFVNREKSINVLLQHAASQFGLWRRQRFTPENARFAACSGGPGLGKTTFSRKAFTRAVDVDVAGQEHTDIWHDVDKSFEEVVGKCVDNGRQFQISFGNAPPSTEELKDPVKSFALRLLYQHAKSGGGAIGQYVDPNLLEQMATGAVLLQEVVEYIVCGATDALVLINIDETNVLMRKLSGVDYLETVLAAVVSLNANHLNGVGFLFIVLSGTNARDLHDMLTAFSSGRKPQEIPLPLLKLEDMDVVLRDLLRRGGGDANKWVAPSKLDYLLQLLGGVPRYLEALVFSLGQSGKEFTLDKFVETTENADFRADAVLLSLSEIIRDKYGELYAETFNFAGDPALLIGYSLFGWLVASRTERISGLTVGDLETMGLIFLEAAGSNFRLSVPFFLLRQFLCSLDHKVVANLPQVMRSFVLISPDENERESLRVLVVKLLAIRSMGKAATLADLFPMEQFANLEPALKAQVIEVDKISFDESLKQVNKDNWHEFWDSHSESGAITKNARSAEFSDSFIITKGGKFAIFIQDKLSELSQGKNVSGRTVPALMLEAVRSEHEKCKVDTPHLFVVVTDHRFDEQNGLAPNEIVLSHDVHGKWMGPLWALMRLHNHGK